MSVVIDSATANRPASATANRPAGASEKVLVVDDQVVVTVNVVPSGSSDPDQPYRLQVPVDKLYLQIPWDHHTQIEWRIGTIPEGVTSAMFDAPAVTMQGHLDVMPVTTDPQSVTMSWSNADRDMSAKPVGRSFSYRLHVLVVKDGMTIPVSHDPVVHNEPPIP